MAAVNCFAQETPYYFQSEDSSIASLVGDASNKTEPDLEPAPAIILRDYELNPDRWKNEELLSIAFGYVCETNLVRAVAVYKQLLGRQPNNARAIRDLGICYTSAKDYNAAISQFKLGWALGDRASLLALANIYCLFLDRCQDVKPFVNELLQMRNDSNDPDVKHDITHVLMICALNSDPSVDKGLLQKSIGGLDNNFILGRQDTAKIAIIALKALGETNRVDQLYKMMEIRNQVEVIFKAGNLKSKEGDYIGAIVT